MAHEVDTMAYVGQEPWHGLGVQLNKALEIDEMLVTAGLDWKVHARPVRFNIPGEKAIFETTQTKVLIRDNGPGPENKIVLGPCGPQYVPTQNSESFKFFKALADDKVGLSLEVAGALDEGRYVWALAKFDDGWSMMDETFKDYLLLTSPHIWGRALQIFYTPIRVVCMNTLMMAMSGRSIETAFRHLHLQEFDDKIIADAREIVKLGTEMTMQFRKSAEFLAKIKADEAATAEFFAKLFAPSLAGVDTDSQLAAPIIQDLITTRDSMAGSQTEAASGTYWGLVNTVTYLFDHVKGNSVDTRLQSAWLGRGAAKKREALEVALKMAA